MVLFKAGRESFCYPKEVRHGEAANSNQVAADDFVTKFQ